MQTERANDVYRLRNRILESVQQIVQGIFEMDQRRMKKSRNRRALDMGKLAPPKSLTWSKATLENKDQFKMPDSHFVGMWIEKHRNLKLLVTIDEGMLHMSISHPKRYPTWDEILRTRYRFFPETTEMVMHLPKQTEYVNIHQNCFHLWQILIEPHEGQEPIGELVIEGAT